MKLRPVEMLPTLVTLGNLFSGFLAIAYLTDSVALGSLEGRLALYERSIFLIFLAMVFDAVDGKVARLTGQSSPFGAQVDSICDAVSFGAAPALLFKVLCEADPGVVAPKLALNLAAVFLGCAVLRLARFALETDDSAAAHDGFLGLPTPGAAAVVAGLAYANLVLDPGRGDSWVRHVLPWAMPVLGFLMVSRFPYAHIGSWLFRRKSFRHLVGLLFVSGFLVTMHRVMVPILCLAFAVSGPGLWLFRRIKRRGPAPSPEDDELV